MRGADEDGGEDEIWKYIISRLDLLVPQDVRERKGAFFTPQIFGVLSQKYIAGVFGPDWQDEYYVWDCCAGMGNLLNGLTNKYSIFASTLDQQDVDVMHERIRNGANLLESHVSQFDFLNDDFSKCPSALQEIINNEMRGKSAASKVFIVITSILTLSFTAVINKLKGKGE